MLALVSPMDRNSEVVGWLHQVARISGAHTRFQSLCLPQREDVMGYGAGLCPASVVTQCVASGPRTTVEH